MCPHYRKHGKILTPLTDEDFIKGMKEGKFLKPKHQGYIALLHYTGIRKSEGLRAVKEQFQFTNDNISFEVGKRLKHGDHTPPLDIPLDLPYAREIKWSVEKTRKKRRVWNYSKKTAYNIVSRVFKYPHYHRLSRITWLFEKGFTISQVKTWTGLTLTALNYYVGLVDVSKMGARMSEEMKKASLKLKAPKT